MKNKLLILQSLVIVAVLLFSSTSVIAQNTIGGNTVGTPVNGSSTNPPPETVPLTNPLGTSDIPTLIGNIIKAVLSVIGSLALVMFIYGGFTWMLAGGSSEKVKKGRDIIVWAAIGLVVIFSSYALVRFVIQSIANT